MAVAISIANTIADYLANRRTDAMMVDTRLRTAINSVLALVGL
jgi:hypothetical protein